MNDKEVDKQDEMKANFSFDKMFSPELYKNEPVEAYEDVDDKIKRLAPYEHYDFYNLSPSQITTIREELAELHNLHLSAEYITEQFEFYSENQLDPYYLINIVEDLVHVYVDESLVIKLMRMIETSALRPMPRIKRAQFILRNEIIKRYLFSKPKRGKIEGIIVEIAKKSVVSTDRVKTILRRANSDRITVDEFSKLISSNVEDIEKWNKEGSIPKGRKVDGVMTWGRLDALAVKNTLSRQ